MEFLKDVTEHTLYPPIIVPTTEPYTGTGDTPPQTIAIVSVAGLSMAGCTFIIVSYILWPEIRTRTRLLLVFLSLADFMNSAGNAAGAACAQWCAHGAMATNTLNCIFQSFVTTYSSICSFAWTVSIAIYLYWIFSTGDIVQGERRMKWLHLVSWCLPLIITLSALFSDALGNDDSIDSSGWCWIRRTPLYPNFTSSIGPTTHNSSMEPLFEDRRTRTFWLIMAGKGWEMLAYCLTLGFYLAIKCLVYRETHHGRDSLLTSSGLATAQKVDKRLIFVPVIFILLRIWGTIRTMLDIADSGHHPESWFHNNTLRLLHGLGDNLQGFANFVIFCWFSPKIRARMLPACCRRTQKRNGSRSSKFSRPSTPSERDDLLASGTNSLSESTHFDAASRPTTPRAGTPHGAASLRSPVASARSSPHILSVQATANTRQGSLLAAS